MSVIWTKLNVLNPYYVQINRYRNNLTSSTGNLRNAVPTWIKTEASITCSLSDDGY